MARGLDNCPIRLREPVDNGRDVSKWATGALGPYTRGRIIAIWWLHYGRPLSTKRTADNIVPVSNMVNVSTIRAVSCANS